MPGSLQQLTALRSASVSVEPTFIACASQVIHLTFMCRVRCRVGPRPQDVCAYRVYIRTGGEWN